MQEAAAGHVDPLVSTSAAIQPNVSNPSPGWRSRVFPGRELLSRDTAALDVIAAGVLFVLDRIVAEWTVRRWRPQRACRMWEGSISTCGAQRRSGMLPYKLFDACGQRREVERFDDHGMTPGVHSLLARVRIGKSRDGDHHCVFQIGV